ncbi:MAG: LmbE family protein [Bacteroidetes bacterium]|nr:LmbE family protein [Bacteroidota bacterium]
MLKSKYLLLLLINTLVFSVKSGAQSSSSILHDIEKLDHIGRVLYIAAHPDDENTRLISYLTNELKADVSYLSITRGDGGQNLIGTEIGDGLGLIRTNELLAARRIDGGHQYFTRAIDFGFSKTPEETLKIWDKEGVLSDMVCVIRKVKPDIIITRFSPEVNPEHSTHGHHTASAQLALLAAQYASDPAKYPESAKLYSTHSVNKIFWNTSYWFYGSQEKMDEEMAKNPNKYLALNVNSYLPLLGKTCSEISALSRSQHKSQGFGSSSSSEEQRELLQLLRGEQKGNELFSNQKTHWSDHSTAKSITTLIQEITRTYDYLHPEKSIAALLKLKNLIRQNPAKLDDYIIRQKQDELDRIITDCLGLRVSVLASERKIYRGETGIPVTIDITSFSSLANVELLEYKIPTLGIQESAVVSITGNGFHIKKEGSVSKDHPVSQPYWLSGSKTLGSYTVPTDLSLIGQPVNPYEFVCSVKIKIENQEIVLPFPVWYGSTDPVKGEIREPLVVVPDVMPGLEKEVYVFTAGATRKVLVNCISGKPGTEGKVMLNLPEGWKCEPAFYSVKTGAKGNRQTFEFTVSSPSNQQSGEISVVFKNETQGWNQSIREILYDHIPNTAYFPKASSSLQNISIEKRGNTIGYLMGAGDKVPDALREIGYSVTEITVNDILQRPLNFDAIVVGVRAFNTLENIGDVHQVLMKYVENGGNVVVQYNTSHRLYSNDIGPFPLKLSRDRVTEEDAQVTLLKGDHPALNTPNKITNSDFSNWVQERGLYFPESWDENYSALLSIHDENEPARNGSLLVANYGKGYFVYTGLSFFRELPAGVPGAFRLMANLVSLGN